MVSLTYRGRADNRNEFRKGSPNIDRCWIASSASCKEGNTLLVVDNCEHVLDEAARVIETFLHSVPEVRVLATSRESLNLDGEHVWRVPSLSMPDPGDVIPVESAGELDSVQLIIDRAAASDPRFRLNESNLDSVVNICRRLDGIPLAIELAAVRIKAMSASEIHKRLDRNVSTFLRHKFV